MSPSLHNHWPSASGRRRAPGRPPSEFSFGPSARAVDFPDQLARFAVRSALMVHTGNYHAAVTELVARLSLRSATSVNERLKPGGSIQLDRDFVVAVAEFLRDDCHVETYLPTYFDELRRFGRQLLPNEKVSLDHTWMEPLTNSGPAPTKPSALVRGWSAVAWVEHHSRDLGAALARRVPGEYPLGIPPTFQGRLNMCVEDLLTVASMPAGQGHLAATALIGRIGAQSLPHITAHLQHSPAGWRALRSTTQMLLYARRDETQAGRDTERAVFELLGDVHHSNYSSAYRARAFFEECADALPRPTDGPETYVEDYDDVIDWLIARAIRGERDMPEDGGSACPVRERQTAAVVAFERIQDWNARFTERKPKWDIGRDLIDPLRSAADDPKGRVGGLDYVADYLQHMLKAGVVYDFYPDDLPVSNGTSFWTQRPEAKFVNRILHWQGLWSPSASSRSDGTDSTEQGSMRSDEVKSLAEDSGLSQSLIRSVAEHIATALQSIDAPNRSAARRLIGAATLAPSGILRRRLLETIVTAGLGSPAFAVFNQLALMAGEVRRHDMRFVVENAVFNMGYMNTSKAIRPLMRYAFPEGINADRAVRMTAMMAIGDLAHQVRDGRDNELLREDLIGSILKRAETTEPSQTLTLPELRASLHIVTMLRSEDGRVPRFLSDVREGRVQYLDSRHRPTRVVDPRCFQLAVWCEQRTLARSLAMSEAECRPSAGWLTSPLPRGSCEACRRAMAPAALEKLDQTLERATPPAS